MVHTFNPIRQHCGLLPRTAKDKKLAHAIAYTWAALSNACHHHAYELAPIASELELWIATTETMLTAVYNAEKQAPSMERSLEWNRS